VISELVRAELYSVIFRTVMVSEEKLALAEYVFDVMELRS